MHTTQSYARFNKGIHQRNIDGTVRPIDGRPVSAAITIARWPDDALHVLREATDDYLAFLSGPNNVVDKTVEQKQYSAVLRALTQYAASVGATQFAPGKFPGMTGLVSGEECTLVEKG